MNKQQELLQVLKEKISQATPFQIAVLKSGKNNIEVYKEVTDLWFQGIITTEDRRSFLKQLENLDKLKQLVQMAAEAAEGKSQNRGIGFQNQWYVQDQNKMFLEQQTIQQNILLHHHF